MSTARTFTRTFYDNIKSTLEERWHSEDFTNTDINTYSKNQLSNKIGMKPNSFGLTVWDYGNLFKNSLQNKSSKSKYNKSEDDELKYETWGVEDDTFGIPFQYIEAVPTWTKGANYDEANDIMGRFEGQVAYSNSSNQDLSISLIYYAESSIGSGYESVNSKAIPTSFDWTLGAIDRFELQLKSLVFPQYDGKYSPPLKVMLNIGNMFVDFPVVIKSISCESLPPYEITTMRSMMRKITIEMKSSYPSWQALSAPNIWTADDNSVFARQEFKV